MSDFEVVTYFDQDGFVHIDTPEQTTYTEAQLADAIRADRAKAIEALKEDAPCDCCWEWNIKNNSEFIAILNSLPIGDEK